MLKRFGLSVCSMFSRDKPLIDAAKMLMRKNEHSAAALVLRSVIVKDPSNKAARCLYAQSVSPEEGSDSFSLKH